MTAIWLKAGSFPHKDNIATAHTLTPYKDRYGGKTTLVGDKRLGVHVLIEGQRQTD